MAPQEKKDAEEIDDKEETELDHEKSEKTIEFDEKLSKNKLYQKVIVEMRHIKSDVVRESGFLSIEMISDQPYLVHRSLAGVIHFKAMILPKCSKIKSSEEKKVKVMVYQMNDTGEEKKLDQETIFIEFLEELD